MSAFEKLGLFYLGKVVDPQTQEPTDEYLLYDSRDLLTHAVCVGMTGSGKTGLCIDLLEEAALDSIPAIVVDPKGDLGNLLLLFPDLAPEDFAPWVNEDEAARQGMTREDFARQQAEFWKRGLADWGQDGERIRRLRQAVDIRIYTPGHNAGIPLSVLSSFAAPPTAVTEDIDLFRQQISTTVSGLLGLLGMQADPLQSREHILISNIVEAAWAAGEALDLAALIKSIRTPPLGRIGVFELEDFYPAQERYKLAMMLNNLLAAPGFASWMVGQPLDIDSLFFTAEGKPRLSIVYIAHLSDAERMFFVTLLLNQLLGWMRKQPGSSSLRALFYMDEIFGFFPPVSEPPAKRPLLTLLKQARAYGLGLVLTTQNPVDLDYKGLANAGTWFIGRLQTEQDKARLLEGLAGVAGNIDLDRVSDTISSLKKRTFLMHNVHEDAPVLFQTRWAMSYLRGPITLGQIRQLAGESAGAVAGPVSAVAAAAPRRVPGAPQEAATLAQRPSLPPEVSELFFPASAQAPPGASLLYRPAVAAAAQLAVVNNRLGVSTVRAVAHLLEMGGETIGVLWDRATPFTFDASAMEREPRPGAAFGEVPAAARRFLKSAGRDYVSFLARSFQITLWKSPTLGVLSNPDESERDFRIRLNQLAREKRDRDIDRLRQKYAGKIATLQRQLLLAEQRLQREEEQYKEKMAHTAISMGATILGAVLGRKASQVGRLTTSARSASRAYYERMDIDRVREQVELARQRLADAQAELEQAVAQIAGGFDPTAETLQQVPVRPKKDDIALLWSGVLWLPFWHAPDGSLQPAFALA